MVSMLHNCFITWAKGGLRRRAIFVLVLTAKSISWYRMSAAGCFCRSRKHRVSLPAPKEIICALPGLTDSTKVVTTRSMPAVRANAPMVVVRMDLRVLV